MHGSASINVANVSKRFKVPQKRAGFWGSVRALVNRQYVEKYALKNVSINVGAGEMVGLLGANGAGKTTLVKILSGIIHATDGKVDVMGFDPWKRKNEYRRQISLIMGQKAQLWWDLPAADCFLLLKTIYQIDESDYRERLDELTSLLGVEKLMNTQIRRLSLGERMKMELVGALLHRPNVIFLDEPTIGLDLHSQEVLRKFILDYQARTKATIVVTSHYMEDIKALCPRILLLKQGELIFDGSLSGLAQRYNNDDVQRVLASLQAPD